MQAILEMLGSVGFNWHVALANFVNFLIILFILNRFVFGKIGKVIENRNRVIKEGVHDAQVAAQSKAEAAAEKAHIIRTAEKEAHEIVGDSHKKAELLSVSMKEDAVREAHGIVEEAKKKRESAKADAEREFRELAPKIVADLATQALRKNMTKELNDSIVSSLS